jgi:hypothetical protein
MNQLTPGATLVVGFWSVTGTECPAQLAAITSRAIAGHHWDATVAAVLGDDLLIEAPLIVFDHEEQVAALLDRRGEKRRRGMRANSYGEG